MSYWLLDLFCGAGGCTAGYQRAGFKVLGVDNRPQPRYCGDEFVQVDALEYLASLTWLELVRFHAVHASPPCQRWADGHVTERDDHPDLIGPLRPLLVDTGLPYVIENVARAPLHDAVTICGGALGLRTVSGLQLHRHRRFESNIALMGAPCTRIARHTVSVVGHGVPKGNRGTLGRNPSQDEKREVMGIGSMNRAEMAEAIPPRYTELVGAQLMAHVQQKHEGARVVIARAPQRRHRAPMGEQTRIL